MKPPMHYNTDDLFATVCGAVLSMFATVFLNIDWPFFMHEGAKILEAFIVGIVGGAGGYFGKKWISKISKNKNNNHVGKN